MPFSQTPYGTPGRDVFERIIYGGQISLFIGMPAVILEVSPATLIGGIAAYHSGWVDALLRRFTEVMLAVPLKGMHG